MKSTTPARAHAAKLSDVLGGLGHELSHTDSFEIISKLESNLRWDARPSDIGEQQKIAEQYLDEMFDAKAALSYEKFTQRMTENLVEHFSEKRFIRSMGYLLEDLGPYVSRQYLGAVDAAHEREPGDKNTKKIRHIWRCTFEKHESFLTVGIYTKNAVRYVSGFNFR